ncbi:MAG: cytochrome c [Dokdonella sp.]|uniref:c-type cytochrome n=1 Tax=Dokdonella sp. TaxID=2291710 RepID=UPI002B545DE3|nr:cytochrome c [Dokdonella sp.]HOX71582.1 cytochrome c [Dokdonella sp.]HPG94098.1 cytochrome c [Dokdonella sp.]HPN80406.1 cytochrome c [Dokdonella sp.]
MTRIHTIKPLALLAAIGAAMLALPAWAAGNTKAENAKELAKQCQACHGADGISTASIYPHLAGQYADYLARALHEYRNGERKNPIMAVYVEKLSDQDILDLAGYFSAMPRQLDDLHKHMKAE